MTAPLAAHLARRVLYVGPGGVREVHDLEDAGIAVERVPSLVLALERLRSDAVPLVVAHAECLAGAEAERIGELRRAGASLVVCLHPPASAWRADRAVADGADAAIVLPAPPGSLVDVASRLVRVPPPLAELPAPAPPPAAPPAEPPPAGPWLEAVVGEMATLHRTTNDLERLLDLSLAVFGRRSAAERRSIVLFDRPREALVVVRSTWPRDAAASPVVAPAAGPAAHVVATGRALAVADVRDPPPDAPAFVHDPARSYRTPSCLLLPLRGTDDVLGVACLADRKDGTPFPESDVAPLRFLAAQVGQAIENGLAFRRLQELSAIDELTGLANRRQFRAAIEGEVQRARRYDRPVSLAILDLDHFKTYNDTCGHQAGDRALAKVGEILRTSLREVDVVARYGGEEFAVILPETSARAEGGGRNPFPFLERLRRRIESEPFPGEEKLPGGRLTVSGGVACFPDDASTVEELIREADRALYESKSRGRNTITYRGRTL